MKVYYTARCYSIYQSAYHCLQEEVLLVHRSNSSSVEGHTDTSHHNHHLLLLHPFLLLCWSPAPRYHTLAQQTLGVEWFVGNRQSVTVLQDTHTHTHTHTHTQTLLSKLCPDNFQHSITDPAEVQTIMSRKNIILYHLCNQC